MSARVYRAVQDWLNAGGVPIVKVRTYSRPGLNAGKGSHCKTVNILLEDYNLWPTTELFDKTHFPHTPSYLPAAQCQTQQKQDNSVSTCIYRAVQDWANVDRSYDCTTYDHTPQRMQIMLQKFFHGQIGLIRENNGAFLLEYTEKERQKVLHSKRESRSDSSPKFSVFYRPGSVAAAVKLQCLAGLFDSE